MKKDGLRKRQNYDGTALTSRHLSDLISTEFTKLRGVCLEASNVRPDLILASWPEVIGEKLSTMTEAVSFVSGVLTVKVRNSSLHSLLSRHDKARIMTAIRHKFPKINIQNIVFRIG